MDKYKKLFSNALIFALGTFSSKILSFAMMPFISAILGAGEYGAADLVQQTVNVLVPIVTLAVNSAALRFALDKAEDKRAVFSTGIFTTGIGYIIFLCLTPLASKINVNDFEIGQYLMLICVFLLASSTRQLCQQFVRGMGWVRLYALDGVVATATNLCFTLMFIGVFKWGVTGMIMAIATSDMLSVVFMFYFGRLNKFLKPRKMTMKTTTGMLRYCIPLIPTVILWWIINVSDRYMITAYNGIFQNGLYAAASKIPNFVVLFSSIFIDAWQLSAVDEYDNKDRGQFFSKVFRIYSGGIFAVASVLILLCQPITMVLMRNYYESWKYAPILIISTVFSCLVNFMASVYMAERKSVMSFITAMSGAVTNIGLNFLLIPKLGPNGAAIATVTSFVIVFLFRAFNTRKYIKFDLNVIKIVANTAVLVAQSVILILSPWGKTDYVVEAVLTLIMLVLNGKPILELVLMLGSKFLKGKKKKTN